tara:strand:+ start:754 stop:1632 length:879 start_codon:yes stop_codon:yes gene_type:complete
MLWLAQLSALSLVVPPLAAPLPRRPSPPSSCRRASAPTAGLSTEDPRVVRVTLDRKTGIDFGCDLTLSWPYVLSLEANGAADRSGEVEIGDQLVAVGGASTVGSPIGQVMERMAALEGADVELIFFRGSRALLQEIVVKPTDQQTVTITVHQSGQPDQEIVVPYGANLRDELVRREINVYQSVTRWTNCNGKQLCGTCIVDVAQGVENCTRRSIDEASTLRENPDTYKLACITNLCAPASVPTHARARAPRARPPSSARPSLRRCDRWRRRREDCAKGRRRAVDEVTLAVTS